MPQARLYMTWQARMLGAGLDRPVGWQPSRFLVDRAEAERTFQLAEQLGSVNAAATQLGMTWPSLRKAFTRHGLGMPARNPEAVRQRAIEAARQRSGRPTTPGLDPRFVALNPGALRARPRSPAELFQWVRREEQYATLGANVVVELYSESHARKPTARAWAIIRRADRSDRWSANAPAAPTAATPTEPTAPADPSNSRSGRWWPMPANLPARPAPDSEQRFHPASLGYESFDRRFGPCSVGPETAAEKGVSLPHW